MISADDAQKIILEKSKPIGSESLPLSSSLHRYLTGPIVTPIDLPPFDNAAMDGFAVRSGDTSGALPSRPVALKIVSTVAAGHEVNPDSLPLQPGEAVRIMTGGSIPIGADTVIPYEEILSPCSGCRLDHPVAPGNHLRRKGEDVRKGEIILQPGEKVTSRTIALLAALGIEEITVFKRPGIQIVSTGSELAKPGGFLPPGKIFNSNGPALIAALEEIGLAAEGVSMAPDQEVELTETLKKGLSADVLITVGGVSAGDFDLVPEVLKELGARILFHRVAIRPGKPFLFATHGSTLVFALPGNPVSALMVFHRFVRPALLRIMGSRDFLGSRRIAVARETLKGTDGKEDYLRGIVEYRNGVYGARSAGVQGSASLLPLSRANAVLIIPESRREIGAEERVEFELLTEEER